MLQPPHKAIRFVGGERPKPQRPPPARGAVIAVRQLYKMQILYIVGKRN